MPDAGCVRIRPDVATTTRQRLPAFVGVSGETTGATGLSLQLVVIPPGGKADVHYHDGYETAIYVLEGNVETRFGAHLEESIVTGPGDFLFIRPNVIHQAINVSQTERAVGLVARNDPNEQEHVVVVKPDR